MRTSDTAPDVVMFPSIKAFAVGDNILGLNQARFQNIFKNAKNKNVDDCPANMRKYAISSNFYFHQEPKQSGYWSFVKVARTIPHEC